MNKPDLNFHLVSDNSTNIERGIAYGGTREWKSSNLKIIEEISGGPRQGVESVYHVYHNEKLIKKIPFSYTGNMKEEFEKIDLDGGE
jgi:hypothetical protein